jgi:hypothetical protein
MPNERNTITTTTMTTNTTQKDFWTEGYEAPCRSNGYQSNRPSAFQIDLHYASEQVLHNWLVTTKRSMNKDNSRMEANRLVSQLRSIEGEYTYRNLPLPTSH